VMNDFDAKLFMCSFPTLFLSASQSKECAQQKRRSFSDSFYLHLQLK
jgi:hypothetical protein